MGDGRGIGVVLGAGAIVGVGYLLWRSREAGAATTGSPREQQPIAPPTSSPGATLGPSRFSPLVERWRGEVQKRAKGLPVNAILEWIRIESGGDMCAAGIPGREAGIFQLYFPDDAKYGATYAGLMALCQKSKEHSNANDITWLSDADLDMQVGAGINKIAAARDQVHRVLASSGVSWPETSFDFGSAVKQIHAAPAVITELVPKIARQSGPPTSWSDFRRKVMAFPTAQMGTGLRSLASAPSQHGLQNRLEDTMANAEIVGRLWGISATRSAGVVGRFWRRA